MTTNFLMNTNFEIFMTFEYIFETFPFKMYGKLLEPNSIFCLKTSQTRYRCAKLTETNIRQNSKPEAYQ
jgi:hypothetical protein